MSWNLEVRHSVNHTYESSKGRPKKVGPGLYLSMVSHLLLESVVCSCSVEDYVQTRLHCQVISIHSSDYFPSIGTCETSSGEMCPLCGPQYMKNGHMVEQVQSMATKMIKGMEVYGGVWKEVYGKTASRKGGASLL